MIGKFSGLFRGLEWQLSLGNFAWQLFVPAGFFALPAWAIQASDTFAAYSPLSWVVAGLIGLLLYAVVIYLIGVGKKEAARAKYDANFLEKTGGIDPVSKVFESKRIFINDLAPPSEMTVEDKTFIDCEIVGPSNIYLQYGNNITEARSRNIDAVALSGKEMFTNGTVLRNCTFRRCSFHRVTIFVDPNEVPRLIEENNSWVRWISELPTDLSLDFSLQSDPENVELDKPPEAKKTPLE